VPAGVTSAPIASGRIDAGAQSLSPEGLLLYLQTRLNGLDSRIDEVFQKQQYNERMRNNILELQKTLSMLDENTDKPQAQLDFPANSDGQPIDVRQRVYDQINAIALEDPKMAEDILRDLQQPGQILSGNDAKYSGSEVTNSKEYFQSLTKQLETGAQLDMIQLQSTMSARQTAIQLATNLTASYNDSQKSIVTNIR